MYSRLLEKYLNVYQSKKRSQLLKNHGALFLQQEPEIIDLLKKTGFYHGTGAYHYHFGKESKYTSNVFFIKNSLRDILQNGLVPQHDVFNSIFKTESINTISLTRNRQYALAYAQLYFTNKTRTQYSYGPPALWVSGIAIRLILGSLRRKLSYSGLKEWPAEVRQYKRALHHWTKSFRRDGLYEGKSFSLCISGQSDIPDNFGMIIGINENSVNAIKINYPNVSKDETRVAHTIASKEFIHIQVPLECVTEVKELLKKLQMNIPIVPIEYVELHNHKLGLRKLLTLSKTNE